LRLTRKIVIKGTIAVLFGLPGTLLFVPVIALGIFTGGMLLVEGSNLFGSAVTLGWGLAGLVGLAGFWAWVFLRDNPSAKGRIGIAACIFSGICAVVPFISGDGIFSFLAVLGSVAGLIICLWLLVPKLPLNPDSRKEQPPLGQPPR
jgi:hypothetical protein